MFNTDPRGNWLPTKMFPCLCGAEGLTVSTYEDRGNYYFSLSFWEHTPKFGANKLGWRTRLRFIWNSLRGRPWPMDMIELSPEVSRNLANHILYRLEQMDSTPKPKCSEFDRLWFKNDKLV